MIWYVCFHPGRCLWGRRFRHVSLVGYDNDTWLSVDLHRTGLDVATIYHYEESAVFRAALLEQCVLVYFGPAAAPTMRRFMRPLTCVSFVKHALGIRSSALLPDTLFRRLTEDFHLEVINATSSRHISGTESAARAS